MIPPGQGVPCTHVLRTPPTATPCEISRRLVSFSGAARPGVMNTLGQ